MSDTPPDHLASDPRSPFYNAEAMDRGVGIRFNGVERDNVEEYCICLLYTSPSPRDLSTSRMPSSA